MSCRIVIAKQAERDLKKIYEYIAFELLAPENAAGQLDRIESHIMYQGRDSENQLKYT